MQFANDATDAGFERVYELQGCALLMYIFTNELISPSCANFGTEFGPKIYTFSRG